MTAVAAWTATYGLAILFAAVALESVGVPVPGESSLVAAGVLVSRGELHMSTVVAVAATAAPPCFSPTRHNRHDGGGSRRRSVRG